MTRPPARSFVPWLLLVVFALIVYGSLYPFNFKPASIEGGVLHALTRLSWQRAGRGDRIANVLLYLPLGFCLLLWLARRVPRGQAVALAVACGALLSLAVEVAQVYISSRVPSLTDLALNTTGALLGAAGGLVWLGMSGLMHLPSRDAPSRDPGAALLVGLWLLWRFAPFTPQIDLGKLKLALQPLVDPTFDVTSVFIYLTCWLVVNQAIAALVSRPRRLEVLLIVIAAVLVGRLLVANQTFAPSELIALLALLPLVVFMHRMAPQPRRTALAAAVVAVVLIESLAPFDFTASAAAFDLWPFLDGFRESGAPQFDWQEALGLLFLYAALTWVLHEWGASIDLAAAVAAALALAIEVLQAWLPHRDASLADPLLAVAIVLLLRWLYQRRSRRPGDAIAPRARNR
ncbi:MAG: VanZ family protein [Steroidobacteraceae bacterium]|jgi:VanZ family protein|nr:VanZ family protein [Steroidobacteraceae bacterium]